MKSFHILLAIFVVTLGGMNSIMTKIALSEGMPPLLMGSLRFLLASIPFILFVPKPKLPLKTLIGIGVSLCFQIGFLYFGLREKIGAGISALLLETQVFFTIFLAAFFLKQKIRKGIIPGLLWAFVGLGFIASQVGFIEGNFLAFLFILLSAVFWSITNVQINHLHQTSNPLSLVVWVNLIPILPMLILSLGFEGISSIQYLLSHLTVLPLFCLLFVSFAVGLIGFTGWSFLLKQYSAAQVVPFSLLAPMVGILMSQLILGERLSFVSMVGAFMIISGIAFVQWATHIRGKNA